MVTRQRQPKATIHNPTCHGRATGRNNRGTPTCDDGPYVNGAEYLRRHRVVPRHPAAPTKHTMKPMRTIHRNTCSTRLANPVRARHTPAHTHTRVGHTRTLVGGIACPHGGWGLHFQPQRTSNVGTGRVGAQAGGAVPSCGGTALCRWHRGAGGGSQVGTHAALATRTAHTQPHPRT